MDVKCEKWRHYNFVFILGNPQFSLHLAVVKHGKHWITQCWKYRKKTWLKNSVKRQSSQGAATSSGLASLEISAVFMSTIIICWKSPGVYEVYKCMRVNTSPKDLSWDNWTLTCLQRNHAQDYIPDMHPFA